MSGFGDGHIKVTFEAIGQAAADCDTINAQFQQELADLKQYLAPMIAVWTGRASEDYQALQRQWDASADDLSMILSEVSRGLRMAQDNYLQTERANSNIWQG